MKIFVSCLLGSVLVVMAFATASCDEEPTQADELCEGGCAIYQDCAEGQFHEEFRDLAECIEACRENFQYNYDHDLAIEIETYGQGARRCFDLDIDYTICFDQNATCGEWNADETPSECYDIANKTIACWDELEDGGTTDPISTDDDGTTDPTSTDDTDSGTGGCNRDGAITCEEQATDCLQQGDMAACMESFCRCLDATGCESYASCMEDYA